MSLPIAFPVPRFARAVLALLLGVTAASCATTNANYYRPALAAQESCCKGLTDPGARNACLADVPRTQDEASSINQETFSCVQRNFRCDPATGRATHESAQAQLDCLNDLESTQQARSETPAQPQ
jgi:hypothetical protein